MNRMSRIEIRQHALRAASRVALLGAISCGGSPAEAPGQTASASSPVAAVAQQCPSQDAGVADDAGEPDTGVADAGPRCDRSDWQNYVECCEQNGWNWSAGCSAWGPPVPPAMHEGEVSV